jgi:lipopolysaccharide export system permease protein
MFMSKIWERYFFREVAKSTFFFVIAFYSLYVIVDYANHASSFHHRHIEFQWRETALYYGCEFARRLEILLPFALMIATIRTLCMLNSHNELIALMASGLSLRTLMRPFIYLGIFCTLLMYLNTEFLLPGSLRQLKSIEDSRSNKRHKDDRPAAAQHIALEDGSTVIFQNYDTAKNLFFDSYWIRSIDDIYRIKFLHPHSDTGIPLGQFVDHLQRTNNGELVVTESFASKLFPEIVFNKQALFETIMQPEEQSLSDLVDKIPHPKEVASDKEAQLLTIYYRKLFMPWLCLIAVLAPAPFCLMVTRTLPIFFIYACSIFGLVAFNVLMSAAVLLGRRQLIEPFWAIWPIFLLIFSLVLWRFFRLK